MITVSFSPVTKAATKLESVSSSFSPKLIAFSKVAFSLSTGIVVSVGKDPQDDEGRYTVIVQHDADTVFVYGRLLSTAVHQSDVVEVGQLIGHSLKTISFGVGRRSAISVMNSVRVGRQSFGYVDALPWFTGEVSLNNQNFSGFTFCQPEEVVIVSSDMADEFSDGR